MKIKTKLTMKTSKLLFTTLALGLGVLGCNKGNHVEVVTKKEQRPAFFVCYIGAPIFKDQHMM